MIGEGKFQMQILAGEDVHPVDFSGGGEYSFSYRDGKQSFKGTITLGMKRTYPGSWWTHDHPVFEVAMGDLDLIFDHQAKGDWELTIGKGWSDLTAPTGRDLTMEEYRQVCKGIASPIGDFLKDLGEPQWGSSSNALEIS
jgi:hypothetical protein